VSQGWDGATEVGAGTAWVSLSNTCLNCGNRTVLGSSRSISATSSFWIR